MNLEVNPFLFSCRYWVSQFSIGFLLILPSSLHRSTVEPNMFAFGQIQMKFYQMQILLSKILGVSRLLNKFPSAKIFLRPSSHPLNPFLLPLSIPNIGSLRKGNSSCSSYKLAGCKLGRIYFQTLNCKCNKDSLQLENIPQVYSKSLSTSLGLMRLDGYHNQKKIRLEISLELKV